MRCRQRKGGKLDPDYIGPYTVINVDGKSIDLKDYKRRSCPKINKDHLVHFLEEYPTKVPKHSDSFPVTVSSALPNPPGYTPALQQPLIFMYSIHCVTLPPTTQLFMHKQMLPFTVPNTTIQLVLPARLTVLQNSVSILLPTCMYMFI